MTCSSPIVDLTCKPVAVGATPTLTFQIFDQVTGLPIPAAALNSLTLTLVDTQNHQVVNGVQDVSILNTGRGTVDALGNVAVTLLTTDTLMLYSTDTQEGRSAVYEWSYNGGLGKGGHQQNFEIIALAAT